MKTEIQKVEWRNGFNCKGDANKCYQEVLSLGEITPQAIVKFAENNPDCELRKCLTMDNDVAAEKWRLHEARNLIGSFVLVRTKPKEQPKRVFQISSTPNVYKPTIFFLRNPSEYERLLSRAIGELKAIQNRYESIAELEGVMREISKL